MPREKMNLVGDPPYGRLTVISEAEPLGYQRRWNCVCDCGREVTVLHGNLRSGMSASCGHHGGRVTHGMSRTPVNAAYRLMLLKSKQSGYKVCRRWKCKNGFANFLEDIGEPAGRQFLVRINKLIGYSPENCKWGSASDRGEGRLSKRMVCVNGVTLTLSGWARRLGMTREAIRARIASGWNSVDAVTIPRTPRGTRKDKK